MLNLIRNIISAVRPVHTGEEAQDTFEYLLVLGVLVVAVVTLSVTAPGLITTVIGFVTTEVTELFALV